MSRLHAMHPIGGAEGGATDWAAVQLRESLAAIPGVAGLAVTGFLLAMAAAWLCGDRLVRRFRLVRAPC